MLCTVHAGAVDRIFLPGSHLRPNELPKLPTAPPPEMPSPGIKAWPVPPPMDSVLSATWTTCGCPVSSCASSPTLPREEKDWHLLLPRLPLLPRGLTPDPRGLLRGRLLGASQSRPPCPRIPPVKEEFAEEEDASTSPTMSPLFQPFPPWEL